MIYSEDENELEIEKSQPEGEEDVLEQNKINLDDNVSYNEENDDINEFEEELEHNIEVAGRTWKYIAPKSGKTRLLDFIRKGLDREKQGY